MRTKRPAGVRALALMASLCIVIALMSGAALAVDVDGDCSLTAQPSGKDSEFAEDIRTANVVIDLYRVAGAAEVPGVDTYSYTLLAPFAGVLQIPAEPDTAAWRALAQDAAKLALGENASGTPVVTGAPADGKIDRTDSGDSLKPGLYLLVARGADLEDYVTTVKTEEGGEDLVTAAQSRNYEYTFAPQLVSLPGKVEVLEEDVVTNTADSAAWFYDQTVVLKPEQRERFAQLTITKHLLDAPKGYKIDPVDFAFLVTAELEGKSVEVQQLVKGEYLTLTNGLVQIHFDEAGTVNTAELRVPVGANVKVEERTNGLANRFKLESAGEVTVKEITTAGAGVDFTNSVIPNHGHSIVNTFVYQSEDTGWEWVTPAGE